MGRLMVLGCVVSNCGMVGEVLREDRDRSEESGVLKVYGGGESTPSRGHYCSLMEAV